MNTVLDLNRKMCLLNGETIKLSDESVNVLFEVDNLALASPATISRVGIICTTQDTLGGFDALLMSWLTKFETSMCLAS